MLLCSFGSVIFQFLPASKGYLLQRDYFVYATKLLQPLPRFFRRVSCFDFTGLLLP